MTKLRLIFASYFALLISLFFFSFTQVDLSLTLSRASIYQTIEKNLQYIGYFNRPMSALIYIVILVLMFSFYFLFLYMARKKKISQKQAWILIIGTFAVLVFSYNAFSYDLFNYIFDAKILTFYHQNPFFHKPLDFPTDHMLSFMRWTHRLYPYGPTWLLLTAPLSFLGLNYFLPTFLIFKFFIGLSFLGTAFYIGKISEELFPENKTFNLLFFALNPLVIIETLISGHNDIPMMFFAVLALYFLIKKKYLKSFFWLVFSTGLKFATGFLAVPFFIISYFQKKNKIINWEKFLIVLILFMLPAIVLASVRTVYQSWYLLYIIPFAALVSKKNYIFISVVLLSFFNLLIYIPYLYLGDWESSYPFYVSLLEVLGISISFVVLLVLSAINYSKRVN